MVKIRLSRKGRRNRPFYRIEVFDTRTRRDGRPVEQIGWYDPYVADEAKKYSLDVERAKYWVSVGAQTSGTVGNIFRKRGVYKKDEAAKA